MFSFFSNLFQNKSDEELQHLFKKYAEIISHCSKEVDRLFSGEVEERPAVISRIARMKEEGDGLKRRINEILDHTFIIKWIDKEDATHLINDMNSCLRSMRRVAKHIQNYGIDTIRPQIRPLLSCIVRMAEEIPGKIDDLNRSHYENITSWNPQIANLETEADELCSAAVSSLWQESGVDALSVIKWERIYQSLERITDHERDIADTILSIARSAQ